MDASPVEIAALFIILSKSRLLPPPKLLNLPLDTNQNRAALADYHDVNVASIDEMLKFACRISVATIIVSRKISDVDNNFSFARLGFLKKR
jgi:hypothetical protein